MADKHSMVKAQLARLDTMDGPALAAKFEELYGFRPCDTTPRHLRLRLAYRIQEILLGGISEADMAALERIAASDPLANFTVPKDDKRTLKMAGVQLRRVWQGKEYVVTVLGGGEFEYNGAKYNSLSRIAREITGGHWNGKLFFGVK